MIFDLFKDACEKFKQKFPETAEKLKNPVWQQKNKKQTSRLKEYNGFCLLESPPDEKSLVIEEIIYNTVTCFENEGRFLDSGAKITDSSPKIIINGIYFWNPEAANRHIKLLNERQTLESIIEQDPEFALKVQTVFDKGWKSFLAEQGFNADCSNYPEAEQFEKEHPEPSKTLMHPELAAKIQAAYELIAAKDQAIQSQKSRFEEIFPDFEKSMQELSRMQHKQIIDSKGWWFSKDIEAANPCEMLAQYRKIDQVVDFEKAQKAKRLQRKISEINFKKYAELEEEHPDIKEKIEYIQENKKKLLPSDYKGINMNTLLNIHKKKSRLKGRGRFARLVYVESRREYDERIIDTINNLYQMLQQKKHENPEERPVHQQERIKKWHKRGRKKEKIADFVFYVLEKAVKQEWYPDFQRLVNGFRFTGDYRINTSKHWSRQNIGYYVSAGQIKGEWGWNTLVSGSEERFDTPGIVLRQLRDHKEEERYMPAAKKFEELVNECILEYFSPETA